MAYRNKTYVCFDGDNDMHYYNLMRAWKQDDRTPFNFYNAHDLNTARDSSQEDSIKRQLQERLKNSKIFVVLIGDKTRYLYKFVRWEMQQAIGLNLPIVAVNLNEYREMDEDRCPPIIRNVLAIHVSFNARIIQYALENWPESDQAHRRNGEPGPYHYRKSVYEKIDL